MSSIHTLSRMPSAFLSAALNMASTRSARSLVPSPLLFEGKESAIRKVKARAWSSQSTEPSTQGPHLSSYCAIQGLEWRCSCANELGMFSAAATVVFLKRGEQRQQTQEEQRRAPALCPLRSLLAAAVEEWLVSMSSAGRKLIAIPSFEAVHAAEQSSGQQVVRPAPALSRYGSCCDLGASHNWQINAMQAPDAQPDADAVDSDQIQFFHFFILVLDATLQAWPSATAAAAAVL